MAAPVALTGTGNVTSASATTGTAMACNKPANVVDGDLMVAFVDTQNNAVTISPPSGWTLADNPTTPSNGTMPLYYRFALSEGSSYTWNVTVGGGGRWGVIIQRVTGADTGTTVDIAGIANGTTGGSSLTIPAVTTTVPNTLLFAGFHFRGTDPAATAGTISGMTNATTSPVTADNATSFSSFFLASKTQATATSTGTQTATMTGSGTGISSSGYLVAIRPVATPAPTAAFTSTFSALTLSVNGSSSTAVNPATITGYDWDWGDSSTHGTGSTASHTYAAGGTYAVTLTVTDSNANTDTAVHSVNIAAPSGTATAAAVTSSTGWTASSGDVLSAITDNDATTFDSSSANPTGLPFEIQLLPMVPPATGQPLKVFFTMDATLAASATLNAQLYEGATSRSTLTGVTIPSGSGTSVVGLVTLIFPYTDVQNVTTGGWNAGLTVKLQVTAS